MLCFQLYHKPQHRSLQNPETRVKANLKGGYQTYQMRTLNTFDRSLY